MNKTRILTSLILAAVVILTVTDLSNSFSFNGDTVPCKGVNVTGYPKMKEQYQRCNASVYEGYKKRNEKPEGYAPIVCTALCGFMEDKLVDMKTGLLLKSGLDNYKSMFEHIPEIVRKDIKKAFYDCFEKHKTDVIYDAKQPNECNGITGVAICIKMAIDGVCNPEKTEEE